MAAKALRYLAAGVRLVWIVWPKQRQVDVWRPDADRPIATLGTSDALDGMDVLPGFTLLRPEGRGLQAGECLAASPAGAHTRGEAVRLHPATTRGGAGSLVPRSPQGNALADVAGRGAASRRGRSACHRCRCCTTPPSWGWGNTAAGYDRSSPFPFGMGSSHSFRCGPIRVA
jgi:hypothetical protein